jgi:iduronate 2-sulfatase
MNKLNKYLFILLLIPFNTLLAQKVEKKNIVFIAVDDLKPLLNCYGYSQMKTPNFDRLAKMGVTFTNANVQQAVCGPSRTSVMTGTYPDHNKVWDLHTDFRKSVPELVSMPEYLKNQGYFTTITGKKIFHDGSCSPGHDAKSWSEPYQLDNPKDKKKGSPAFRLFYNDSINKLTAKYIEEAKKTGLKGTEEIENYAFKKLMISSESFDVADQSYEDGLYANEAVKKLKKLAKKKQPFFYAIGFSRPHLPFNAPKKYWDLYDINTIEVEKFQELVPNTPSFLYHNFGELRAYNDIDNSYNNTKLIPEEKQRELIHGYMACVSFVDAQLGKILDAIEDNNLSKNTIIVVWGDHGYHLGDHTMWNKHSNFEQATRIPLMFAGPSISKNKKVNQPVELLDLFPTLFDLCDVEIPNQLDGISLKNLLDNDENTDIDKDFALSQYPRHGNRMGYSIRTEKFRYTEWHKNGYTTSKEYKNENIEFIELYDYSLDPLETKNVINDIKHEFEVKLLKEKLVKHLEKLNKKNYL